MELINKQTDKSLRGTDHPDRDFRAFFLTLYSWIFRSSHHASFQLMIDNHAIISHYVLYNFFSGTSLLNKLANRKPHKHNATNGKGNFVISVLSSITPVQGFRVSEQGFTWTWN